MCCVAYQVVTLLSKLPSPSPSSSVCDLYNGTTRTTSFDTSSHDSRPFGLLRIRTNIPIEICLEYVLPPSVHLSYTAASRRQYSLELDQKPLQHQYSQDRRREGSRESEMSDSGASGSSPGAGNSGKPEGGRTGPSKRQKQERESIASLSSSAPSRLRLGWTGKLISTGQPLRRGDACLMCRAKKLVSLPSTSRFKNRRLIR